MKTLEIESIDIKLSRINKSVLSKPNKIKTVLPEVIIKLLASISLIVIVFIFIFVFAKAWPVLQASGMSYFFTSGFDTQISEAFYSSAEAPMLNFGMFGLIAGTITSTFLALIIATIIGIGAAIAICELAPRLVGIFLTGMTRMLASIPSVVFGLIGIVTIVPIIQSTFITTDMQIKYLDFFQMTGRNLLSSVIVLTFMIVPIIITLTIDAIKAVPKHYKEAGFAFGMPHFRVISKIILPSARSGIIASVILAAGRGIGEAIAVSMVCGGLGIVPNFTRGFASLLAPVLPLSAAIVNKSEAMGSMSVESALFSCGAILLLMGAFLSLGAKWVERLMRRSVGYED